MPASYAAEITTIYSSVTHYMFKMGVLYYYFLRSVTSY